MAKLVGVVACLCTAGTLLGCAPTSQLLAKRFSKEHSCQVDEVRVHEGGANRFEAVGCGQSARYICGSNFGSPGSENGCEEQGIRSRARDTSRDLPPPNKAQYPGIEPPR